MNDQINAGDLVIIQSGKRTGETAKVAWVRLKSPDYAKVEACSLICLDGRQSVYLIEELKKA